MVLFPQCSASRRSGLNGCCGVGLGWDAHQGDLFALFRTRRAFGQRNVASRLATVPLSCWPGARRVSTRSGTGWAAQRPDAGRRWMPRTKLADALVRRRWGLLDRIAAGPRLPSGVLRCPHLGLSGCTRGGVCLVFTGDCLFTDMCVIPAVRTRRCPVR